MRLAVATLAFVLLLVSMPLRADEKDTDFNPSTDFLKFKTFTIRQGQIQAKAPELNSTLVRKKIEEAIRTQLVAKGLTEVERRPDVVVNFRLGSATKREVEAFPTGRWGRGVRRQSVRFTEGTLIINLMDSDDRELVWRGVYRDDESNPAKISNKLPEDVKKLLSDFPPKKKK